MDLKGCWYLSPESVLNLVDVADRPKFSICFTPSKLRVDHRMETVSSWILCCDGLAAHTDGSFLSLYAAK